MAFGSLKETHYLIEFCSKENMISAQKFQKLSSLCTEVEKMLYSKIKTMKSK